MRFAALALLATASAVKLVAKSAHTHASPLLVQTLAKAMQPSEAEVQTAFNAIDTSKDGEVSMEEAVAFIE